MAAIFFGHKIIGYKWNFIPAYFSDFLNFRGLFDVSSPLSLSKTYTFVQLFKKVVFLQFFPIWLDQFDPFCLLDQMSTHAGHEHCPNMRFGLSNDTCQAGIRRNVKTKGQTQIICDLPAILQKALNRSTNYWTIFFHLQLLLLLFERWTAFCFFTHNHYAHFCLKRTLWYLRP